MSTGLLALLDDITALVKVSAASLDDIPAQVAKTSGKVSGVVIDDAAVTPKYVVGLDPSRELSIIARIARRSIINKIAILAPAALLLGYFAPWAIHPILMLGGAYLCFEGYEKIHSLFAHPSPAPADSVEAITPQQLEKIRIKSAIQTDFILSAEIIAITYSTVADKDVITQCIVLFCVAVGITAGVYGVVAIIVKADDIGLYLAKNSRYAFARSFGQKLVKAMPPFLKILGYVGTVAMLWVGAEIIAHGIPPAHHALEYIQNTAPEIPALAWAIKASLCAMAGVVLGALVAKLNHFAKGLRTR